MIPIAMGLRAHILACLEVCQFNQLTDCVPKVGDIGAGNSARISAVAVLSKKFAQNLIAFFALHAQSLAIYSVRPHKTSPTLHTPFFQPLQENS